MNPIVIVILGFIVAIILIYLVSMMNGVINIFLGVYNQESITCTSSESEALSIDNNGSIFIFIVLVAIIAIALIYRKTT